MVSFQCESCGDVFTKKKLDGHRNQCYGATYSCLDCMIHFEGIAYRAHTSCISEAQKYQGALYRPTPKEEKKNKQNNSKALVPHNLKAYVEDADDEYQDTTYPEPAEDSMPAAPSPPSAAPGFTAEGSPVNVFDFLVASSTPNQSRLELTAPEPMHMITDGREEEMDDDDEHEEDTQRSLVRVRFGEAAQTVSDLVEYGNGPVATDVYQYETPAPKQRSERKKEKKDRDSKDEKKDKKRKRLHVETHDLSPHEDETMTDAPPVLHSGLTGGLNRLMSRPDVFPPSPDYSGGDAAEPSPGSPLKKTKHAKVVKRGRADRISNGILSLISNKRVSSREHSDERPKKSKQRKHRDTADRQKLIEYKPIPEKLGEDGQVILYSQSPRAELLLSFVNKGPESERGVSMNKALKRYHRERVEKGLALGKVMEEKELWRSLRMKKNDRGEIVLFL